MPHVNFDQRSRSAKTWREWLGVTAQIGDLVNEKANREDLVAYIGEGAGQGSPACYVPNIAEIEIDVEACFGKDVKPDQVPDMRKRKSHYDWPEATGAVVHEAAHARFSQWDLEQMRKIKRRERTIVEAFEESRIEKWMIDTLPKERAFLRAAVRHIILGDIDIDELLKKTTPFGMSRLMLLSSARVDAGVCEPDDVAALDRFMRMIFPNYDEFRDLWRQAQALGNHDSCFPQLHALAVKWIEILPKPESGDQGDGEEGESGESNGKGESSGGGKGKGKSSDGDDEDSDDEDGEGQGITLTQDQVDELLDALDEMQDETAIGAEQEAAEQEAQEIRDEKRKVKEARNKEASEAKATAKKVFAQSTAPMAHDPWSGSGIVERREPTGEERAVMIKVSRDLERARYRDRVSTEIADQVPPGKLKTRIAVQGVAQRATGQTVSAAPWHRTQRKHTEDPTLKVGVMVDVSGSMSNAQEPMAVVAYAMSEACYRIQATYAQVYFGQQVLPAIAPGQRESKVVVRSAVDGTEKFNDAFKALDGALTLIDGTGARLLVIVSDTAYKPGEHEACDMWIKRCIEKGIGVVILPFEHASYARNRAKDLPKELQVVVTPSSPSGAAAAAIGEACVKAIEAVGNKVG